MTGVEQESGVVESIRGVASSPPHVSWTSRFALLGVSALLLMAVACKPENRPQVETIGGAGAVSISGADESAGGPPSGIRYTPTTPQDLAAQAGNDLRDLRSVMNVAIDGRPVDWTRATQFYEAGRNQKRPDGSIRSLASLADADAHALFPDGAKVYGRANFIDAMIRDGLTGTGSAAGLSDDARRQYVDRGVSMVIYARALNSMNRAKVALDAKTPGAPAALDEAWAYITGVIDADAQRPFGLLQTAINLETDLKLNGKLTRPLEAAFITALAAAQKGDVATFDKYTTEARGELAAIFYLSTLKPARALESTSNADARASLLADGWTAFQPIRATVTAVSPGAANAVQAAYTKPSSGAWTAADTQAVYQALNEAAVLQALGIPAPLQLKQPPAAQ
jgi:hypothetical protein